MDCVECEARSSRGAGFAQGMGQAGLLAADARASLTLWRLPNNFPTDRRFAFLPEASLA